MKQTRLAVDKPPKHYIWQRTTVSEYAARKEVEQMRHLGYNAVLTYNADGTITVSLV